MPSPRELLALPGFARQPADRAGLIQLLGEDGRGNRICFLGNRARFEVLERVIREVGEQLGASTGDIVYADTMPYANWLVRLGSVGSQALGLGPVGAALAAWGARAAYPRLVELVRRTRASVGSSGREPADPAGRAGDGSSPDRTLAGESSPDRSLARGHPEAGGVKVFYHCYGSSHTSVVAAAIHTGRLDPRRTPTLAELNAVPHFDRVRAAQLGTVFFAGHGPDGEEVYVIGFGPGKNVIRRAVLSFLALKDVPPESYLLADALSRANWVVKVGGIASRRLGLVSVGRPIAALGIQLVYRRLVELVEETRAEVRRRMTLAAAGRS